MTAVALIAALVLGLLPFLAGFADLITDPAALADLASPRLLGLWSNTVLLGLATAIASLLIGAPVGWVLARCRGAGPLGALLPVPLILPPWVVGVAWTEAAPLSGFWGAVFLLTASLWPLVALFAVRGFRPRASPATWRPWRAVDARPGRASSCRWPCRRS